ncbi:hypothetical protein B296_00016902, partial [Ensete ventricosum]
MTMVYHRLLCSLECSNALLCIQVYVNALALLMRIYMRDHMHHIAERLMSLANVFKDEDLKLSVLTTAIEEVKKQVCKRGGAPFLWQLL